jgi:hypothetical protein
MNPNPPCRDYRHNNPKLVTSQYVACDTSEGLEFTGTAAAFATYTRLGT